MITFILGYILGASLTLFVTMVLAKIGNWSQSNRQCAEYFGSIGWPIWVLCLFVICIYSLIDIASDKVAEKVK